MREILFRGKRIDNGEWVYGYYICKQDPFLPGIDTNFIVTFDENSMSVWNKVDPATVGQGTGLTDKNGKKIFEGDIISIENPKPFSPRILQVTFEHASWMAGEIDLESTVENWNCLIIGNEIDTPELCKEASNAPPN